MVNSRVENRWTETCKRFTSAITGYFTHPETVPCEYLPQKYSYIFRRKSRWELTHISAIVSGIEFCYAAETAFVAPVLLSLGLNVKYVSMIWCLSPLLAFIFTPILGSLSDSCSSKFGRRRPFIFILSIGIILGLIFVPFGGRLGLLIGDNPYVNIVPVAENRTTIKNVVHSINQPGFSDSNEIKVEMISKNRILNDSFFNVTALENASHVVNEFNNVELVQHLDLDGKFNSKMNSRVFGIVITAVGTVLLDFCADVCQSPCRAYLLDITIPDEHAAGLAVFSLNSGLGATVGYGIAAINWDIALWKNVLEGQVAVVFGIITFLYLLFLSTSLYRFPEIPLPLLKDAFMFREYQEKTLKGKTQNGSKMNILSSNNPPEHSSIRNDTSSPDSAKHKSAKEINGIPVEMNHDGIWAETKADNDPVTEAALSSPQTSLKEYLKSIFLMPKPLRVLCLANFFYGMGIMSYTIFFTDFVGECIFNGNPQAPKDSESYQLYKEGVRFGCWGMAFSSLSGAAYSSAVEDLAKQFGAKVIFVGGALLYSAGMLLMAVTRHKVSAIILSSTAGIMITTLSTLPYMLVSHYHSSLKFQESIKKENRCSRGLGTDVATVVSIIVLSQCILSLSMGTVVETVGSKNIVMYSAALFSTCGAVLATRVMYFEM